MILKMASDIWNTIKTLIVKKYNRPTAKWPGPQDRMHLYFNVWWDLPGYPAKGLHFSLWHHFQVIMIPTIRVRPFFLWMLRFKCHLQYCNSQTGGAVFSLLPYSNPTIWGPVDLRNQYFNQRLTIDIYIYPGFKLCIYAFYCRFTSNLGSKWS